tara:strand:- start:40 stop:1134 length:1095 start_codon:yes stop_codon:yes gene_type:complete
MKYKIAIVGAGNAGCITALHFYKHLRDSGDLEKFEISMYHSPDDHPIEKVGQGTTLTVPRLIADSLNMNWHDNPIGATFKSGILYEGWGKKQEEIFSPFIDMGVGIHFVPNKLSKTVLDSGFFKIKEKVVKNPEDEIDANVIFDCRGRHNRDLDNYDNLINPLNTVILSKKFEKDHDLTYTRCVATPNGWTFVIPNQDSVSYGYLYNKEITSKDDAIADFTTRFNLDYITDTLYFDNYVAKNFKVGERTILQGNMYGFIEPLEATSLGLYISLCRCAWDGIFKKHTFDKCNVHIKEKMIEVQNMILWHYQFGSRYDTPFWDYAKSLPFNPDKRFYEVTNGNLDEEYGQWEYWNFENWKKGVQYV